ncbi:MAG: hypothetical protein H8D71_01415 [Deltaproteobacteria bacterium]|nr:hypothetical protein [Deltaproteobacteria bacterium]
MMDWWIGGPLGDGGELLWGLGTAPMVAVAVLSLVACGFVVRRPGSKRGLELVLWLLAIGVLGFALSEPVWFEASGRLETGRSVVLVDHSRSMGVVERGESRADRAGEILSKLGTDAEVFHFGAQLQVGPPTGAQDAGTQIGAALSGVTDRFLGQELTSIVLITDGIDRGGLREAFAADSAPAVPKLPGPLTVYQVGSALDHKDQAITNVQSGGFAFLRTPFNLDATIEGTPGRTLNVTLRREGRLVDTIAATLDADGKGTARFEITPNAVGRFVWEVSIPVQAADGVPGNNRFPVVVRVVRDRTRVLQVCGSPSYDQKFLRLFLKEDPSVDLVSFFILRTHEDFTSGWYPDELSLIAFPYERLFTEQLSTFDVVIFQNFNFKPYFERDSDGLLGNIARFVRGGGAFVMIGGDRSFDLGEYAATPIEDILPVKLGIEGPLAHEAAFRPQPSKAGLGHPVMRIAGSPTASVETWARLPDLDGMNRTGGASEGAAVLLEHPSLRAGGEPMPLLAVREVGEGRTMALMSDASWRWSFSEAATGRGNQAYLRFWKGALRWLGADPEYRRMAVRPSVENLLLGGEVRLTTLVRDTGFGPIEGSRVTGWVEAPNGDRTKIEAVTDAMGSAVTRFMPDQEGAHRVWVESTSEGKAGTVFSVTSRDPELADIAADPEFLQRLAAAYGARGAYRAPDDFERPIQNLDARRLINEQRSVYLASIPLVALLFGLFGGLAWWVRRRNGGR